MGTGTRLLINIHNFIYINTIYKKHPDCKTFMLYSVTQFFFQLQEPTITDAEGRTSASISTAGRRPVRCNAILLVAPRTWSACYQRLCFIKSILQTGERRTLMLSGLRSPLQKMFAPTAVCPPTMDMFSRFSEEKPLICFQNGKQFRS